MAEAFDSTAWQEAIGQPDWYIRLYPELSSINQRYRADPEDSAAGEAMQSVRQFFTTALKDGSVSLGESGPNLDAERQPIDTVVIHHTSWRPGYDLDFMNALQLLNVYVPTFNREPAADKEHLKGLPMWSNHLQDGRPVFFLYHWLMRMDGTFERLLDDEAIGWHAANWDVNRRSIAICLDNDYEKQDPTLAVLQKLGEFITTHYQQVTPDNIVGHGEVANHGTVCPGTNFVNGWKQQLLDFSKTAKLSA